jgi:hypothetical protein
LFWPNCVEANQDCGFLGFFKGFAEPLCWAPFDPSIKEQFTSSEFFALDDSMACLKRVFASFDLDKTKSCNQWNTMGMNKYEECLKERNIC